MIYCKIKFDIQLTDIRQQAKCDIQPDTGYKKAGYPVRSGCYESHCDCVL